LLGADVVIRPKVGHISSADFSKKHEAIFEVEKAAIEALPQIMAIVTQLRQEGRLAGVKRRLYRSLRKGNCNGKEI